MSLWKRLLSLLQLQTPVNHAYQTFLVVYEKKAEGDSIK